MTRREAAIITAYTGILLGKWDDFVAYAEELMGRPLCTHEFAFLSEEIKKRSKEDFINLEVK